MEVFSPYAYNLSVVIISFSLIFHQGKLVLIIIIWGTTGGGNLLINS